MICENCREAAAIITGPCPPEDPARMRELHEMYCKGSGWCDCQHKLPVPGRVLAPTLD